MYHLFVLCCSTARISVQQAGCTACTPPQPHYPATPTSCKHPCLTQVLVTQSTGFVEASQAGPYEDILLRTGPAMPLS